MYVQRTSGVDFGSNKKAETLDRYCTQQKIKLSGNIQTHNKAFHMQNSPTLISNCLMGNNGV